MPDPSPPDVKLIAMRKVCGIPIRRTYVQHNPFAFPDVRPIHFDVLDGSPEEYAREAGTTQQFLHSMLQKSGLTAQNCPLLRRLQQCEPGIREEARQCMCKSHESGFAQRFWAAAEGCTDQRVGGFGARLKSRVVRLSRGRRDRFSQCAKSLGFLQINLCNHRSEYETQRLRIGVDEFYGLIRGKFLGQRAGRRCQPLAPDA